MRFIILFLSLMTTGIFSVHSQNLNKNYIDNWILRTFPKTIIDTSVVYIINGVFIENNKLDSVVSTIKISDLIYINLIDKETIQKSPIFRPTSGIVLLATIGKLPNKSIRKDFRIIKDKFKQKKGTNKNSNPELLNPALIINGNQINSMDCGKIINKLVRSEIVGTCIIDKPVSREIYGMNGSNGLILITTR